MQAIDLRILDGRDISSIFNFGLNLKEKNLEGQINAHNVFSSLIEKIKDAKYTKDLYLTGIIKQEIWNLENKFGWNSRYYSQAGQDKIIFETFFKNLNEGFFVDLGAYDGIMGSNSFFFEKHLGWQGVLVEPSKNQFAKLYNNRVNKCINKAVSKSNQKLEFVDVVSGYTQMSGLNQSHYQDTYNTIRADLNSNTQIYNVDTSTFNDLVTQTDIDYLSIDIEGGELDILKSIDFNIYKIKVISVENNKPNEISYSNFLETKGFKFFEYCGADEIYFNPSHICF